MVRNIQRTTMSLRLLFGMLASALPDQHNYSETTELPVTVFQPSSGEWTCISKFQLADHYAETYITGPARLHIGMLTISLLVGLAYGGFTAYTHWTEKDVFLGYIRNLVIALVCRTFFTIIFDGVVLLGSPFNVGGGNTLSAFEQICINLVLGLWLSLTVYAHARVQRNFKSEPTLRLYQYGIPGVAVFFAFVWIFAMQHNCPKFLWWSILNPFSQWIVHSANLLFLLIQLGLVGDMCRMMMPVKATLDNDSLSLLWKVAAMMAALVFIFWLQFGLSLGLYKLKQSYLYFFYFVDGIECTLVCVCFYLFYRWVTLLRNKSPLSIPSRETEITTVDERDTEVLPGGRGIVTVDSICVTHESGRWKASEEESSKDVVYSNVVEPHRLQKTLELYKRFSVLPNQVTVVDGEQFYDCHIPLDPERVNQKSLPILVTRDEKLKFKNEKMTEPAQKKSAFYSSKYLILDSKEGEIPKYLETRPSVSSVSESPKEEQRNKTDPFAGFEVGDLVRKWLNDNSENMPKDRKTGSMIEHKELSREDSDLKTSEPSTETTEESLLPEKANNNRLELGKQSIPKTVPKISSDIQIDLDLSTENDAKAPRTETPADAKDINNTEGTPSGGVPSQALNAESAPAPKYEEPNKSDVYTPAPTKTNEPEAKDKPTEPLKSYLTYSELLEFRSKQEKPDEPPASTTESIISKVMNAGSYFLTSLASFAQADKDFTTDEKLPRQAQAKYDEEQQTGEKLTEELRPEEPKPPSDLTFSSLPEKQTAEQPEDAGMRPESINERELTLENEIKNDNFDFQGMKNLELQSFIADREQLPQKLTEEEESSLESSLGSDSPRPSFNLGRKQVPQKPTQYREESLKPSLDSKFIKQPLDLKKVQPPQELGEYREEPLKGFLGSEVVRQALDLNKVQPPQELGEYREEPLKGFLGSEVVRQALDLNKVQPPQELGEYREEPLKGFLGSGVVRQALDLNKVQPSQKQIEYKEELVETSSDSEFSVERPSFSSVLRKPTDDKEKSLKRYPDSESSRQFFDSNQNLPPQKLTQNEEELLETSSGSEFSIEKRQSFTSKPLSKPFEKYEFKRTADAATSQSQATPASDSATLQRNPSSSSSESFSLEQYYTKVLKARSRFQN